MDLSICIVSWNTKALLRNCIDSIKIKTEGINYEIIVVDNNSTDGTVEMLTNYYNDCKLLLNKDNYGFGKANNQGIKIANGEFILFLNPDTELITNALKGMVQYLKNEKKCGAIGCKLLNKDGSIQFTCARTYPTLINQLCHFTFLNRIFYRSAMFGNEDLEYWDHKDSREVDAISGACLMTRKDIIMDLDGFDKMLFMYGEDVDLCYRITKVGFSIYYMSEELIYHYAGASSKQKDSLFVPILLRKGHYYFFQKHKGKNYAFMYRLVVIIGCSLRLLIIAIIMKFKKISKIRKIDRIRALLKQHIGMIKWAINLKN